ncbi:MAG: isochorismatase family protein [Deltaproteobacteria bacterium]|nr:MAG: isochorismatase family protein [Deltaproteobacteria bacterium]
MRTRQDFETMSYRDKVRRYNIREGLPIAEKTALLVIDMQHYFQGLVSPILDNVLTLIDACRTTRVKIVFTRHGVHDPQNDGGMLTNWWDDLILHGSEAWELDRKLKPRSSDLIIDKNRYSAFQGTGLDDWLRKNGVADLIVGGVMTNLCCETTARDAFGHDYRVFFVADATATINEELHLATLMNLAYGFSYIVETKGLCSHILGT